MKIRLFCLLTLLSTTAMAQPLLVIERRIDSSEHVLTGRVGNLDTPARYHLALYKSGSGGTAQLAQSGTFDAGSDSRSTSSIRIRVPEDSRYRVTLALYNGNTLLAETELTYPD